MSRRLLLSLSLLLAASVPAAGVGEASREPAGRKNVPAEFKGVDFGNFAYPTRCRKQKVRLRGGKYEEYEGGSGAGRVWFELEGVSYHDLTGDGREEAVVLLRQVKCGGSCDGGSHLIYVYTVRGRQPTLVWRVETGSLAYDCGLKSLAAEGRRITLEAFRACRLEGAYLRGEPPPGGGGSIFKFGAKQFTRLVFEFDGRTFAPKRREVFPNPREDVKGFSPTVSIGHE